MIGAVVLAAGESRRMGRQKLLLPFGGKTVIRHIVDQLAASRVERIVVVTGHDRVGVADAVSGANVELAHNGGYARGMLTSVRCGIAALPPETAGFLIALGDQPNVNPDVVNALIDTFTRGSRGIIVPMHDNDTGHPILISARYREAIMTQFDDTGLRGLIYGRPDEVLRLPVGTGDVLRDMDTPEDYERELRLSGYRID